MCRFRTHIRLGMSVLRSFGARTMLSVCLTPQKIMSYALKFVFFLMFVSVEHDSFAYKWADG
jgi:hypothetical protein